MSNHTRAPNTQHEQVTAIVNELRRSDARGSLLMFEAMYAFDLYEKRGTPEDREILREKIEAIRAHLFPARPSPAEKLESNSSYGKAPPR